MANSNLVLAVFVANRRHGEIVSKVYQVVHPGDAKTEATRPTVHRFDNFGTEDTKQLSIVAPAIMGPAYIREASELVDAAAGGPPDVAKMVEVFRRHGMTIAAPPPPR